MAVQPDTETFLEQETTGLRVKSAVELNNPLIYGNEAGTILLRSTPSLELMRDSMQPEGGSKGLLDRGITKLTGGKLDSLLTTRNVINDYLGIPQPVIPTAVYNQLSFNPQLSVQDVLDMKNGTEFGKFLKQTGGGTPKTIVNQAIGNAITLGKDKLRDILFGKVPTIKGIAGVEEGDSSEYRFDNTYTDVYKDIKYTETKDKDDVLLDTWDLKQINLAKVSPIYGVDRKSDLWSSKLGEQIQKRGEVYGVGLSRYSSAHRYVNYADRANQSPIAEKSLEKKYGLSSITDALNSAGGDDETRTTKELESLDLVPFWIGEIGAERKSHFRTIITGLTETVSPSWNSNSFFGNPFQFYTYSSIERGVSFTLQIYCSNPYELLRNWQRVNSLTKYTYPNIPPIDKEDPTKTRYVNPPIIDFRIGDMYDRKVGFIESLSYTYPDNGVWETDPEIGMLPKFIEVAISIKFIETDSIQSYYNYKKSDSAIAELNDQNGSSNFSTDSALSSNGTRNVRGVGKLNSKGLAPLTPQPPKIMTSLNGVKSSTPYESQNKTETTDGSEPRIPNTPDGKSNEQLINDAQSKLQLSRAQAERWINEFQPEGYKIKRGVNGLSMKPGDIVLQRPDSPDIIIMDIYGKTKLEEQPLSSFIGDSIGNLFRD